MNKYLEEVNIVKIVSIDHPKGIIPACDVPLNKVAMIAQASSGIKGVNALKVGGIRPTLTNGLPLVVKTIRDFTDKPIIFDYQRQLLTFPIWAKLLQLM